VSRTSGSRESAVAGASGDQADQPGQVPARTMAGAGRRRPKMLVAILVTVGGLVFASLFAFTAAMLSRHQAANTAFRPTGIPANVSTGMADRMQLSPVPARTAPGFTLTGQAGRSVSLAGLRGREVVLTFMDPHCTDICPIVSREFIDGRHDLGAAGSKVVFVAVNVNPYHLRTSYVIDPRGRERYIVVPMDDHTTKGTAYLPASQLAWWAHGVALVARDVLAGTSR